MILRRLASALRRQDWITVLIEFVIVVAGVFFALRGDNGHFDSNIPNSEVPLRGVHWGVELGGKCGQPGQN